MCGIIGYIGCSSCFKYIYNGLQKLQNRGYDSAGVCTLNNENKLIVHKHISGEVEKAVELLKNYEDDHSQGTIGLGHTRWLTHGSKTIENAHPHQDYKNRISLVHNGIIENFDILKKELETVHNIPFKSETDSEVIVNLISMYYDKLGNFEDALVASLKRLKGTWALGIICIDKPNNLYCARHGSPLLVGYGLTKSSRGTKTDEKPEKQSDFMMIASEQNGFIQYVDRYITLNDNDLIILKRSDTGIIDFENKHTYDVKSISTTDIVETPAPYDHWTLFEIHEQTKSSTRAINYGGRILGDDQVKLGGLDNHKKLLCDINHLVLLGCGTSYFAGLHGVNFFKEICDFDTVSIIDGGEFKESDIPKRGTSVLILLSQSGETKDLHRCIGIAKAKNIFMIGVINVVDSYIAREVNCGCYLNAGRELGVASTKSFTSQIIVLALISIWFAQIKNINTEKRKEYIKCLMRLPEDIKEALVGTESLAKELGKYLKPTKSLFILGKGWSESIAKEASLKIKELGYVHAEGYSSVALKHGPFSLLQEDTPVIFINPDDDDHYRVKSSMIEVSSRNTPVIVITDAKDFIADDKIRFKITVPKNNIFKGVLHVIPLQFVAYYLSLYKGNNPDYPRNLAKCITVF
jgi:glucosamine--fructose-6-phosphate aminotransferase (isomerizing)